MLLEAAALLILASDDVRCPAALAAAPQYIACAEGRLGVALSAKREDADLLLAHAEAAEPQFRRHFPADMGPYLVLYFEDEPPLAALREAGFPTVLAWPSPAKVGELFTAALRQNALAAIEGGGSLSETAEATLRLQTDAILSSMEAKQASVVAHELGHRWYEAAFWRNSTFVGDGYGTPAPDWMDEAAAVLTEGDALAENRRKLFAEEWAALTPRSRSAPTSIGDLTYFLKRRHPSQARESAPNDSDASISATVTVRSGPNAKEAYYNQVRVFADYLISRAGDEAVFAEASRALAAGESFVDWLHRQTRFPALPRTVLDLQSDWISWIDSGSS